MKTGITYRLFFAMLAATGSVVVAMIFIMHWSIGRGFLGYVNKVDEERIERLATELENGFSRHRDWEFIRNDPVRWNQLLARSGPDVFHPPPLSPVAPLPGTRPPLGPRRMEERVFLVDANRSPVSGPLPPRAGVELRAIRSEGRVVGYVGILPRKRLTDALQVSFLQQQKTMAVLGGIVVLVVSAALSFPLANRLVRPIRLLAAGTRRLAGGDFGVRVESSGSDELGQLARDFNALAAALEGNEKSRRQWVADISHELRTPLAILRGEIEAIQDGVRDPDEAAVSSLHAEALRLTRLVEDLYQLSLADVGGLTYRKAEIDLSVVVRDAADSFESEFARKGLYLKQETTGVLPVFADRERLLQLFGNLLGNSLKYTDCGGGIEIRAVAREGEAVIDFTDTAPGIPEGELDRVFERLYRVESSRNRSTGGAGLGLSICKTIVEAHEGEISARPSPLGGLWITIRIPLAGKGRRPERS